MFYHSEHITDFKCLLQANYCCEICVHPLKYEMLEFRYSFRYVSYQCFDFEPSNSGIHFVFPGTSHILLCVCICVQYVLVIAMLPNFCQQLSECLIFNSLILFGSGLFVSVCEC